MKEIERTEIPISDLRVHPKNLEVYWPHVDPEGDGRLEHEEVPRAFVEEMRAGQINPIKIDTENRILSGARRLVAARQGKLEVLDAIRYKFESEAEEWRIVLLDNRTRRDWPVATRYKEAKKLAELYKDGVIPREELEQRAKERGGDPNKYPSELAASAVGWSPGTYHNVGYVMEDHRGPAKTLEDLEDGEKKAAFRERLERLRARVRRDELSAGAANRRAKKLKEEVETEIHRRAGNLDESEVVQEQFSERADKVETAISSAADAVDQLIEDADAVESQHEEAVRTALENRRNELFTALQSLENSAKALNSYLVPD